MDKPTDTAPLHWEAAVPFKAWLSAPALRRRTTLIFVVMVVAPAVIFWYVSGLPTSSHSARYDYNWLAWAFAVYVGVAWLVVLWLLVRPKVVWWHAALVSALALASQVPLAIFLETQLHSNTNNLAGAIFTVGVPEEFAKLVPLLGALLITFIALRREIGTWLELSPRSYLFLGALSGLAFGCAEQAHFLVNTEVPALLSTQNQLGGVYAYTEQVTWRLISDPITHACWAGITGYFIGIVIQRLRRVAPSDRRYRREIPIPFIGLAIAILLHGFNDYFVTVGDQFLWVLTIAVSTTLFVAYAIAGEAVEKELVGISRSTWTFRVGDLVQLPGDPQPAFHTGRTNLHWKRDMSAHLGDLATITEIEPDRTARLDIDRGAEVWALDWLRPELKVGDRVRIPTQPQPPFDAGGYVVSWQPDMDALLGRSATVTGVNGSATVHLDVGRPAQEWAIDWLDRDGAAPELTGAHDA
jgi:RsiW-degrading membrane proteinase PrsW (M82 family)